jgi:hypothetical protein
MLTELWEQNQEINNRRTTVLMTRGSEFEVASTRIAVMRSAPKPSVPGCCRRRH